MSKAAFYAWKLRISFWTILFMNLAFPACGSAVIDAFMIEDLGLER